LFDLVLADLVASGKLKVVGAVYDIASARVIPV
jgi:carbonic anhydrase